MLCPSLLTILTTKEFEEEFQTKRHNFLKLSYATTNTMALKSASEIVPPVDEIDPVIEEIKHHAEEGMHIHASAEHPGPKTGCGILGRYPLVSVILFALLGVGLGIGLSFWEPEDTESKDNAIKWIGLIGDLFVRSLKLVILPLVFINVIVSVVDMMSVGRAGSIGWKTVVLYLVTTLVASFAGIVSILSFKGLFTQGEFDNKQPPTVRLGCIQEGMYLTENNDTSITCSFDESEASEFLIDDISGTFVKESGGIADSISLSDTIYDGVFTKLIADNLTQAFNESNFAAVVFFAIVFGVSLANVILKKEHKGKSEVLGFLMELDQCFITIIHWIIMITPFAVLSLIASAIGGQKDLTDAFANVGYLVLSCCFGFLVHHLIVHHFMFYMVTKWNPLSYLKNIIPAQTMAFACASSAATVSSPLYQLPLIEQSRRFSIL